MNISSFADKVGGFAATNTGRIEDCYADTKIKSKLNTAGFVYENNGKIYHSIAESKIKTEKNTGGFFVKNKGEIQNSTWIKTDKKKKKKDKKDGSNDPLLRANDKIGTDTDSISGLCEKLNLSDIWKIESQKGKKKIFLNEDHINAEQIFREETAVIAISTAEEMFSLAAAVASGDADAASASYRLTGNINLHGKKWLPIGLNDQTPFTGTFDGAGHKIYNFSINSSKLDCAGFFGYINGGKVCNLDLDCEVNVKNSSSTGSMVGINDEGVIINCHVKARVNAEKCFGGFIGRNMGTILKSGFTGKVHHIIPPLMFIIPTVCATVAILSTGAGVMIHNYTKSPYKPSIIDPNQEPVIDDSATNIPPPPPGSNRISFELNQEAYVNVKTQVGTINYTNPSRSTQDVVISARVTDAELLKVIGRTGRTAKEQAKLEEDPNYDPAKSYHELYRSGRLQIGYQLKNIQLSALQDGTYLPVGDYEMMIVIDAYNPETQEKAVVSAQAPITVHVVEPQPQK